MSDKWPSNWPTISAKPERGPDFVKYSRGDLELYFDFEYELLVEPDDSLSLYSKILYDNFGELNVFGRVNENSGGYVYTLDDIDPITNKDLIHAGETLYHAPTVEEESKRPPGRPGVAPIPTLPIRPPPKVTLPNGAEIIAADGYDAAGWGEWMTSFPGGGYVTLQDIVTFVQGVLHARRGRKIAILHIQVHGYPGGMQFGDPNDGGEFLSPGNFNNHRTVLDRLTSAFAFDAWVVVRACQVGQNHALMRLFRQLWNVNIFAGVGDWNNIYDFNWGNYIVFERGGKEYKTSKMPPAIQHSLWRKWQRN